MTHKSQTQHRPGREQTKAKELSSARSEIKKLGREVARLRKRLEKYETAEPTEEAEPEVMVPVVTEIPGEPCSCGAQNWAEIVTPSGVKLFFCRSCKIRKPTPL